VLSTLLEEFDRAVLVLVTAPANRWPMLDQLLAAIDRSTLLAGGIFVAVLRFRLGELSPKPLVLRIVTTEFAHAGQRLAELMLDLAGATTEVLANSLVDDLIGGATFKLAKEPQAAFQLGGQAKCRRFFRLRASDHQSCCLALASARARGLRRHGRTLASRPGGPRCVRVSDPGHGGRSIGECLVMSNSTCATSEPRAFYSALSLPSRQPAALLR